jgi:polyisoprenoid-binding protein YceI
MGGLETELKRACRASIAPISLTHDEWFVLNTQGALSMKRTVLSASIATMMTVSATGAAPGPALDSVKAGTYKVESLHTQVGFSLSHFGFTNYSGIFSGATGSLELDPTHLRASKLDVTIPIESILTTVPKLTDELKGDKWFDIAKFPRAVFTSTSVALAEGGNATVSGNLTLHGVTRPVVLHVHLIGAGVNPLDKSYTIGFQASGTIKRTDFGVSLYAPALGDEVELSIAGAF